MNYTVHDILALIAATIAYLPILLLPGLAVASFTNAFAVRRLPGARCWGLALLAGYAALPVIDSLLCRFVGLGAALALNLALALYGLRLAWRWRLPLPSRGVILAGVIWFVVLAALWVDFDTGSTLYPSLLVIDIVKHAATVRALVETGTAPPIDPFFLRDGLAGYYYFYYVLSAAVERLGGGWIDSRAAVGGQVFWTGIALVFLTVLLLKKVRFVRRPPPALVFALMAAAGIQILTVIGIGLREDMWLSQINWASENQVTPWTTSLLWVPHHVASFIACWAGFLLLATAVESSRRNSRQFLAAALAGLAFASAAGLSVWVTAGAAIAVGIWIGLLAWGRHWHAVLIVLCAGALSATLFLPDLLDIMHNRAPGPLPIAFDVRSFEPVDRFFEPGLIRAVARLITLPIAYGIEFGVLMLGTWLFWQRRMPRHTPNSETARLMTISAVAGLVVATFLKSTIANNDLGWRIMLFAQMAALLWTAAALHHTVRSWTGSRGSLRRALAPAAVLLALGYGGALYDIVFLRAYQAFSLQSARDPAPRGREIDHAMRQAYEWLAANTGRDFIVQHNPDVIRAFAYGLYGRSRVAVSDRHNAPLFGASKAEVDRRLIEVMPVFSRHMTPDDARRRLQHSGVDAVIVTPKDPVWHDRTSWVWARTPVYASDYVRVVSVPDASP